MSGKKDAKINNIKHIKKNFSIQDEFLNLQLLKIQVKGQ